jgi:hypothetical protein
LQASGNINLPLLEQANKIAIGKASPQEMQQFFDAAKKKFLSQHSGAEHDPKQFGQLMGMWNSLGTPEQMAFMFGVPMAMIGMLGGGGLSMLLGGLGIGMAGMGAGAAGMLGDQTQAAVGRMGGDLLHFFGQIPDEALKR